MSSTKISLGGGDRSDRGHPQGSGKGWRPWKPQCTVAITGVTERTKKTALQEAFGDFGRIIRIEVPDGKTVAFVEYEEKRDAADAIQDMNGKQIEGRHIGVRLVEDLPPKVDRNAPRDEEKIVHVPASGRAGNAMSWDNSRAPQKESRGRREGRSQDRRENKDGNRRAPSRSSPTPSGRRSRSGDRRKAPAKQRSRSRSRSGSGSGSGSRRAQHSRSQSRSRSRRGSRSQSRGSRSRNDRGDKKACKKKRRARRSRSRGKGSS